MSTVIARYKVKRGRAEENLALVRAVYEELEDTAPAGFSYRTYLLEDGVSFVHVAVNESAQDTPLTSLSAFKTFQEGINDRCEEGPSVGPASPVGAYGETTFLSPSQ